MERKWFQNDAASLPLQKESRPDCRFRLPLTIDARGKQLRLVCLGCMSRLRFPSLHPKRCRRALQRGILAVCARPQWWISVKFKKWSKHQGNQRLCLMTCTTYYTKPVERSTLLYSGSSYVLYCSLEKTARSFVGRQSTSPLVYSTWYIQYVRDIHVCDVINGRLTYWIVNRGILRIHPHRLAPVREYEAILGKSICSRWYKKKYIRYVCLYVYFYTTRKYTHTPAVVEYISNQNYISKTSLS